MNDLSYELATADLAVSSIRELVLRRGLRPAWSEYRTKRHIVGRRFQPSVIRSLRQRFIELAAGKRL